MSRSVALPTTMCLRRLHRFARLLHILAAVGGLLTLADAALARTSESARLRQAIERARALTDLPSRIRVQAVDPELAADPDAIRKLDAFVVRDPDGRLRPVIYLNADAEMLRQAAGGSELHIHLLAAVIVHEQYHLAGAPETEARRGEIAFIQALARQRRLPPAVADTYVEWLTAAAQRVTEARR